MKKTFQILLGAVVAFASCSKDDDTSSLNGDEKMVDVKIVDGYVQKGPFINGTAITISELNSDLNQTGKTFNSQIVDNKGTFEIRGVGQISQYAELTANGYYFNEVANDNSESQLTLSAIVDLSTNTTLNVNVLTTLEKSRMMYLMSKGTDFDNAKKQAQAEILSIFSIADVAVDNSEKLDISKSGDGNAILLAISSILQGNLKVADLSELLANMATDIREDGTLDSKQLRSRLKSNALVVKNKNIRKNVANRYDELGVQVEVPDFEKYIAMFLENTDFEIESKLVYPEKGVNGVNLLTINDTVCEQGNYSLTIEIPKNDIVAVRISSNKRSWGFEIFTSKFDECTDYDESDNSRMFTAVGPNKLDLALSINGEKTETGLKREVTFEVFENNMEIPVLVKRITFVEIPGHNPWIE